MGVQILEVQWLDVGMIESPWGKLALVEIHQLGYFVLYLSIANGASLLIMIMNDHRYPLYNTLPLVQTGNQNIIDNRNFGNQIWLSLPAKNPATRGDTQPH